MSSHILLVDDNDDDREYIEDLILNGAGNYTIHALATGSDALVYFNENTVDCVLLDYRLETESGMDVLLEMRSISPFTPVIMLTGQGDEEIAAESIKNGSADYLVKQHLSKIGLFKSIDSAVKSSRLEEKIAEQENQRRLFLQTLVHDLRSPLRNIESFCKLLMEESEPEEIDELLRMQSKAAKRAVDLISTLESYALLDGEVPFENVSLTKIADDARQSLAQVIGERQAEIVIHDMPTVHGNTSQLGQLFQNLMHNGIKYCDSEKPTITVGCQNEVNDKVTVFVRDNGIGIPKEHLKIIFAPLKRLWGGDKYKGTGLGLAICQKIVERHKGTIWCSSVEGEGSTFFICLPKIVKSS